MKKNFTVNEICKLVGFTPQFFYKLKKDGVIPPADDASRTPHTWRADNPQLIEFLKSRDVEITWLN